MGLQSNQDKTFYLVENWSVGYQLKIKGQLFPFYLEPNLSWFDQRSLPGFLLLSSTALLFLAKSRINVSNRRVMTYYCISVISSTIPSRTVMKFHIAICSTGRTLNIFSVVAVVQARGAKCREYTGFTVVTSVPKLQI